MKNGVITAQKMKFYIKDFFSKCDQVRRSIETRKDPKVWLSLSIASISLRHGLNLSSWNFKLNLTKFLGKFLSEPSSNKTQKFYEKRGNNSCFPRDRNISRRMFLWFQLECCCNSFQMLLRHVLNAATTLFNAAVTLFKCFCNTFQVLL